MYRSMNVNHLLDDELEYEIALRKVAFSSGESRDIKRRKLRATLKEERESNSFVSRRIAEEAREPEARQVEEKLTLIRDSLENRKVKKADFPQLGTRLVHLYFRLLRLKQVFNTNGVEEIALRLLNEYFSVNSRDPEIVGECSKRLNEKPGHLSTQDSDSDENEEVEKESERQNEDESEEEYEFTMKNTRSRRSSTPIKKSDKLIDTDELVEKIMSRVDKAITAKLEALNIAVREEEPHKGAKKKSNPLNKLNTGEIKEQTRSKLRGKQQFIIKGEGRNQKEKLNTRKRTGVESSEYNSDSDIESERASVPSDTDSETEQDRTRKTFKRRPRPVCDWKLKYDGRDEGRGLNKFVSEVEFMAEAENISKRSLFNEAIHLFSGDARAWYIEGRKNREFRNWNELVVELKLEYQPPDLDYHYEQQASSRRQKRGEKFQDYYHAIKEIFEQMAVPPTEQRKFDIIFRNLRSDYKNSLLVKGVRTLRMLKVWGRKLDSANWFLYRKQEGDQMSRSAQVHELNTSPAQKGQRFVRRDWKDSNYNNRTEWKNRNSVGFQGPRSDNTGYKKPTQLPFKTDQSKSKPMTTTPEPMEGNSRELLQRRVDTYRIPERTICFNCRGNYHHSSACLKPKEIFCTTCGFQGFSRLNCPFCEKNMKRSM